MTGVWCGRTCQVRMNMSCVYDSSPFFFLLPSSGSPPSVSLRMDSLRCFNSSNPAAVNVTQVYDDRFDSKRLYFRDDRQTPLALCSSSSFPPSLRCLVCRADKIVHILCHNLEKAAELVMEALGKHINITEGGEKLYST